MEDDFKHLVRISRKDVDGNKTIQHALTEIKGIGLSLSRSICLTLGLNTDDQIGYISAAGVLPQRLDHREVMETAAIVHDTFHNLLAVLLRTINA